MFKFNDDFVGRAQEIGNLFVSGVLRESVFEEIHDLAVAAAPSLILSRSCVSIDEVRRSLHDIRLHLSPMLFLLQFLNRGAFEHISHLTGQCKLFAWLFGQVQRRMRAGRSDSSLKKSQIVKDILSLNEFV